MKTATQAKEELKQGLNTIKRAVMHAICRLGSFIMLQKAIIARKRSQTLNMKEKGSNMNKEQ